MENINLNAEDLKKLISDVAQIKEMLLAQKEMQELDLTPFAENELKQARIRKTKISHEEAKKILFSK